MLKSQHVTLYLVSQSLLLFKGAQPQPGSVNYQAWFSSITKQYYTMVHFTQLDLDPWSILHLTQQCKSELLSPASQHIVLHWFGPASIDLHSHANWGLDFASSFIHTKDMAEHVLHTWYFQPTSWDRRPTTQNCQHNNNRVIIAIQAPPWTCEGTEKWNTSTSITYFHPFSINLCSNLQSCCLFIILVVIEHACLVRKTNRIAKKNSNHSATTGLSCTRR